MNNIELSVIIPVYMTEEKLLRSCIDSVVSEQLQQVEIILVDDGTQDDGGKICDEYARKYNNVRAIHQENSGVSVARNRGIKEAYGEYIAFVDADDIINISTYKHVVSIMKETLTDICVFMYRRTPEFEKKISSQIEIRKLELHKEKHSLMYSVARQEEPYSNYCFGSPWGKIFKKDFLDNNKLFFDPNLRKMQDRVFMLYCLQNNPQIIMVNLEGYCYIQNSNSIVNKYNKNIGKYIYNVAIALNRFNEDNKIFADAEMSTILCKLIMEYLSIDILHINNKKTLLLKRKELKNYCRKTIFKMALKYVNSESFTKNEKIKIMLLKRKCYGMLIILSMIIQGGKIR